MREIFPTLSVYNDYASHFSTDSLYRECAYNEIPVKRSVFAGHFYRYIGVPV